MSHLSKFANGLSEHLLLIWHMVGILCQTNTPKWRSHAMLPELKLERFVDQFVVGGIVFVGAWYFNRPFLHKYFPNIAGGGAADQSDASIAIILFVLGAIAMGVLLSHAADVAVVVSFSDLTKGKTNRPYRTWLRAIARL